MLDSKDFRNCQRLGQKNAKLLCLQRLDYIKHEKQCFIGISKNRGETENMPRRRPVSKTADCLRTFFKERVRTTLTVDVLRRLEAVGSSERRKNRAAIEWKFESLLGFAWPICLYICSFISEKLRRKIGLLRNSMKLMDCNCLPTIETMFSGVILYAP